MNPFRLLSARLLIVPLFVLGTAAGGCPPPVLAQPSTADPDKSINLVEHLREYIRSDDVVLREYALVDVAALANCVESCTLKLQSLANRRLWMKNSSGISSMIDLTGLAPDLLWVYRVGPSDELRLLALSSLLYIGDESSIERLLRVPHNVSSRVETVMRRGVAAFFVERYPELRRVAKRTGTITVADIHAARIRHDAAQNRTRG